MNKFIFYVSVRVVVRSNLSDPKDVVAEFEQESLYNFDSTENVEVLDTEYLKTELTHPEN